MYKKSRADVTLLVTSDDVLSSSISNLSRFLLVAAPASETALTQKTLILILFLEKERKVQCTISAGSNAKEEKHMARKQFRKEWTRKRLNY